ncbi:13209_t:CDS:2 [Funneliformis geosporum]|uniref:9607_t:CDS:1 n=1 Tax=Funneliformis geosporum TaxID=1117311 RepID=A0A9W4WII2_9GLOM|nr:9607_t:CDS:2 [Funneliformis geosporum]CAI2171232.1 13209_t:CDS:2 [Funneliformis geosporum]
MADPIDRLTDSVTNGLAIAASFSKEAAVIADTLGPFIPLISDITHLVSDIIELYQKAEHNKRICGSLLSRATAAETAVNMLKIRRLENEDVFKSREYYNNFQKLVVVIDKIKEFIEEVSQIKGLRKFLAAYSIEEKFTNLTDEFDGLMRVLNFTMAVQNQIQMDEDHKVLISDVKEMNKYLKTIEGGIVNDLKEINASLDDITQLNIAWQKRVLQEDNNVLESATIKMTEIHDPHETVKRGSKVYKKIRMGEDIAIKEKILGDDEKKLMNDILSQVVILKKLKESQYILQFYGIAQDANAIYMVTEWCDYGNLKEFYQDYGPLDWHEKTQLAVDIARGLTFLHTVGILHHDIRSENILITNHRQAKLANFTLSRGFNDPTKNMMPTIDTVRWMAPEKLKDHRNLYTAKCEIYSFGMLLWEIAEEKIPFSNERDILKIRNLIVKENVRPSFSNTIPPEWVKITYQALHDSPNARPPLRDIFMTLNHLYRKFAPSPSSRPNSSRYPTDDDLPSDDELDLAIEDLSINVITVREAISEHKKKDGDKVKSWDSFKYHADEFNDITARYWKGYYLYYGLCPIDDPSDKVAKRARLEEAANLFKEAADYGLSDAQLRYGHCLWSGDGVRKSISQAIEYFQLSADGGNPTAMYNIGNLYYNGLGVQKDEEKGVRYLRLAALREQPKALEMCKRKCISLV